MIDLSTLRDAVADALAPLDGVRVYPYLPGQVQPPCLVLSPGVPYVERNLAMGRGLVAVRFRIVLLVPAANVEAAQRSIDLLVAQVPALLDADRTLGGLVEDAHPGNVEPLDEFEVGGAAYLGTTVELTVYAQEA